MKFFDHFEGLFSGKFAIAKDLYSLFKLEAKLVGLNLYPFLISFSLLIAFVITLWLTLMLLAGDLVCIFCKNVLVAILMTLIINFLAALLFARDLKRRLQQMSFARTRDCLSIHYERSGREPEEESTFDGDR